MRVEAGRSMTIIQRLYFLLTKVLTLHEVRNNQILHYFQKCLWDFLSHFELYAYSGAHGSSPIDDKFLTGGALYFWSAQYLLIHGCVEKGS